MSPLPEAVQKQVEETQKIAQQLLSGQQETPDNEDQSDSPVENSGEEISSEDVQPTQDIEPTREEPESEEESSEDWEHKYRVLQGKYNAEVPRLHDEVKELRNQNGFFAGKLELLEKLVAEKTVQPSQEVNQPEEETLPTEVQQLKEDFPDIYAGVTKLVESLVKRTQNIENKLGQSEEQMAQTKTQMFLSRLTEKVPDWEEINVSPEYLQWLQAKERYTGKTRHELLLDAYNRQDVETVAGFFLDYKAETAPPPPAQTRQNILPPAGRSGSSSRASAKPFFKQSEIEEFYRQKALGKVPGADSVGKEKEIIAAMQEGRVLFNQ